MKKKKVTIKHLARKLNVSVSTVSRALRDAPDVKPETKKAVLELVEELNYKRSFLARSLVSKRTYNVGVIVPDIAVPFFGNAIAGMQEYLHQQGYNLIICSSNEEFEKEKKNVELLLDHQVDGLMISLSTQTKDYTHLEYARDEGLPVVLFDRVLPGQQDNFPKVLVDDQSGAYKAIRHLLERGYRKIAHISGPEHLVISRQRTAGYKTALENAGIALTPGYLLHFDMEGQVGELVDNLLALPDPPDAIFAINDPVAFAIMHHLLSKGVRIPEEMGIVGFTGGPMSKLYYPSLSSVRQPSRAMGKSAAKMLLKEIESPSSETGSKPKIRIIPTELEVGQSSQRSKV
ncbi:LacI family DNA-binding transcriptional regulator [Rapidithrix thailandica]|uniref:LacI family DNA-binding transcriptional regulator n=1 Tax=Rapidithrix thailandica TaxID=413964 RepID=A0AAW9SDX1_9BACT